MTRNINQKSFKEKKNRFKTKTEDRRKFAENWTQSKYLKLIAANSQENTRKNKTNIQIIN